MATDKEGRVIREIVPLEGLRKMISDRMLISSRDYPQGTAITKIEFTGLVEFREKLKAEGVRVTFGDIFVKAAACALEQNMPLNASRKETEIHYYDSINIGMMATVNNILMEPVIANAQNKTVVEISEELAKAYDYLKRNKLMRVNLEGSTFSISNLGMFNVDGFTPMLSPPLGAILGFGATRKTPVALEDNTIVVRPVASVSLTTDHGLVDGVAVVKFLGDLADIFADPAAHMFHRRDGKCAE